MRTVRGIFALADLTVREAVRQRLWILVVLAVVGVCVAVPSLDAVDDAARLKLAVAVITGVMGFVTVVLSILLSASIVRRDLDARVGFLLFSKPLSRFAYLAGRWCGLQLVMAIIILVFALAGTLSVGLQLGRLPRMIAVVPAAGWAGVDHLGKVKELPATQRMHSVSGRSGNGIVFRFADLPAPEDGAYDLLLRLQVRGGGGDVVSHARLSAFVPAADGPPVRLDLAEGSPYGGTLANAVPVSPGEVAVRNRRANRTDLSQDYLRLRLPADLVRGGAVTVQFTRLDDFAILVAHRDSSCFVATRSGSFTGNLLKAGLVVLAQSGLLVAVALCCACLSNVGVTLFAALTYYFAGNAVEVIRETLRWEKMAEATRKFLELLLWIVPDFSAFPVSAKLAASRAIRWATIGEAWQLYSIYLAVFFALAWIALKRREQ